MNESQLTRSLTKLAALPIRNYGYASAALTGSAIDVRDYVGSLRFEFNATSLAGGSSPTLDVAAYTGPETNALSTLVSGGAFAQVGNTAAAEAIFIDTRAVDRYIAFAATVAGTGTFAFAVDGFGIKHSL